MIDWLKNRLGSTDSIVERSSFFHLAPTSSANIDRGYESALRFALDNENVRNIALSGPYGSGKSSIIKTFSDRHSRKYKFLNISLAAFDINVAADKNEAMRAQSHSIERSILQQLLYGADSHQLPYSRFKRIVTPKHPFRKSLLLVLTVIVGFILFRNLDVLMTPDIQSLFWWAHFALASFVTIVVAGLISSAYRSSFRVSIKKISLANAEIETGNQPEDSILNRHLDEILYFFQETAYDVVVIEDLDRFRDPSIFVKLREINKLVNDNSEVSRSVKFLYALSDDMFLGNDRPKFFDLIVPVIPVINSYNSIDKMQERLAALHFKPAVDERFLREVSLYIDDFRMIHNIFNEYSVYHARIKSPKLNDTRLLAILIYKNFYPSDFERLHFGDGAFFGICQLKSHLIETQRRAIRREINETKQQIEMAENEQMGVVQRLIDMYLGRFLSYAKDASYIGLVVNNAYAPIASFSTIEGFEQVRSLGNIIVATHPNRHPNHEINTRKSFADFEQELHPGFTFDERKAQIEQSSSEVISDLKERLKKLDSSIAKIQSRTLSDLIQNDEERISEVLKEHGVSDSALLLFLLRGGHIDENYHLYTSNFYEGRMTQRDREFLLTIRNLDEFSPTQEIDNPAEVVAYMRESDFHQRYALNTNVVDFLLDSDQHKQHLSSVISFVRQNVVEAREFFAAYLGTGRNVSKFLNQTSIAWPGFALAAGRSMQSPELLATILNTVDTDHIVKAMNDRSNLSQYLSENGDKILSDHPLVEDRFDLLKGLHVKLASLESLRGNRTLLSYIHANCLYKLNPDNVLLMLEEFGEDDASRSIDAKTANFTAINSWGSKCLQDYVANNLTMYVEKVFLRIKTNNSESVDSVIFLLNEGAKSTEQSKEIIESQNIEFESLESVDELLWNSIIKQSKLTPSWTNLARYLKYEDGEKEILTQYIDSPNVAEQLASSGITEDELGEEAASTVSEFVFEAVELNDDVYGKLARQIPYSYQAFPKNASERKCELLIETCSVQLTPESFSEVSSNVELLVGLIECSWNEYLARRQAYPLDVDILSRLLTGPLSDGEKFRLVEAFTPEEFEGRSDLASEAAELLLRIPDDLSSISAQNLEAIVLLTKGIDIAVTLLSEAVVVLDRTSAMSILEKLGKPYEDIAVSGKRPKLPKRKYNVALARALEARGFVSSVSIDADSVTINTHRT